MLYLAHSIASAKYQSVNLFRLTPYSRTHDGTLFYGIVTPLKEENALHRKLRSCLVELDPDLRDEILQLTYPGGAFVEFFQQKSQDWLVAIKAQNIIASKYMRLRNEDMQELLSAMDS